MADKGRPGGSGFALKDHLFNADTLGQLAREYSAVPGFDPDRFLAEVLPGLASRELMARLDWIADCVEAQLPRDFNEMADALEAAMPPQLDPNLRDDDFGQFIHAVPGILTVRHGLAQHRVRAMDVLHAATRRFSMEFYIRPFINHWPEETMAQLNDWVQDDNYHVRRLVSEGTRPRLPWAKSINLNLTDPLPLLDQLYADTSRFVTRSVANHLNDIAKKEPDVVMDRLEAWKNEGRQTTKELDWITAHALRTLVKQGHPRAMRLVGFDPDVAVTATLEVPQTCQIGATMPFTVTVSGPPGAGVLIDYAVDFVKSDGSTAPKVFKLKKTALDGTGQATVTKNHRFKGDATTFRLYPGAHAIEVQINGVPRARAAFDLIQAPA